MEPTSILIFHIRVSINFHSLHFGFKRYKRLNCERKAKGTQILKSGKVEIVHEQMKENPKDKQELWQIVI